MEEWAAQRGLEEFSQRDVLALYADAFPADRREVRNLRLRERQRAALQALGASAVVTALPHHLVADWFPDTLSRALASSGVVVLSDLLARVQRGGCWWRTMARIGVGKAGRLARHLETLLPGSTKAPPSTAIAQRGRQLAASMASGAERGAAPITAPEPVHRTAPGASLPFPSDPPAPQAAAARAPSCAAAADWPVLRDYAADVAAVRVWLGARACSDSTAKSYRREMGRFLLFLEQAGRTLGTCTALDCQAYVALLKDLPAEWTAGRGAPLVDTRWRPFAGPLSPRSQHHAVVVVSSCFTWLVSTRYIANSPWAQVQRQGVAHPPDDKTAGPWADNAGLDMVRTQLRQLALTEPGAQRLVFLIDFVEATGLRATELLDARLSDIRCEGAAWVLQVRAAGARGRALPLAEPAQRALMLYLGLRGLSPQAVLGLSPLPLLASLREPAAPLSYRVLYGSMQLWLNQATKACGLAEDAKVRVRRASLSWLRHSFGARGAGAGVPPEALGRLLGLVDPRSTARYRSAPALRAVEPCEAGHT